MDGDEAYWEQVGREAVIKAIDSIEEAGKELVSVMTLLQGVYFAALSLGDLNSIVCPWVLALLVAPAPVWLVGVAFAMRAFVPRDYRRTDQEEPRQFYERIMEAKRRDLRRAQAALLVSMVLLLAAMSVYLISLASCAQTP